MLFILVIKYKFTWGYFFSTWRFSLHISYSAGLLVMKAWFYLKKKKKQTAFISSSVKGTLYEFRIQVSRFISYLII